MLGITDADSLVAKLQQYGELKETQVNNDKDVLDSFRETIISRKDSLRERLNTFYSDFGERDAKLSGKELTRNIQGYYPWNIKKLFYVVVISN